MRDGQGCVTMHGQGHWEEGVHCTPVHWNKVMLVRFEEECEMKMRVVSSC